MSDDYTQNASSLLITRTVPRFKQGRWEQFDDTITCENPYRIVWKSSSPCGSDSSFGKAGCDAAIPCAANSHLEEKSSIPLAGEKTLWAYPLNIEPLLLGHVLLDLCPADSPLCREVSVEAQGPATYAVSIGESLPSVLPLPPERWRALDVVRSMDAFIAAEGLWDSTGCFHRAGVFDIREQQLLTRAEDIGRHNCIDRLAGWSVLSGTPLSDKALLISARMTSSLCAKAIRAGFRIIVSRSAVTSAAIGMAEEANVTLLGFARSQEQRFTVFHQGACEIYHEQE